MGMSGSEGLSCHHKLAISEVTRSLHLLSNLRSLLLPSTPSIDRWPDLANDIFDEVLRSYKLSVSMLLRPCGCFAEYSDLGDTMSGEMEPERMDLVYATAPSCQGNGTMKDVKTGEVLLERMGASYSNALLSKEPLPTIGPSTVLHGHQWRKSGKKRANNAHNQRAEERKSWTTVTPAPHFDGHQWRKYGEKHISNSEFPRNYYRCSHFKEQKCPATKTIQQKEGSDDPAKFIVAYKMRHTCKSMELVYPLFVERSDHREPVISFAAGVVAQRKLNEAEEDERGIEIISYSAVPVLIDLNLTIEA